jgi:hypothetical protein
MPFSETSRRSLLTLSFQASKPNYNPEHNISETPPQFPPKSEEKLVDWEGPEGPHNPFDWLDPKKMESKATCMLHELHHLT